MCRTEGDPTRLVLGGGSALDVASGHEMDEAPTVIVTRDVGVGGQDGMLAVGAEHFGRCDCGTVCHCLDIGQSVFIRRQGSSFLIPQTFA